jgi:DNA processing protein
MLTSAVRKNQQEWSGRRRYRSPYRSETIELGALLARVGRGSLTVRQLDLLRTDNRRASDDAPLYFAGRLNLLDAKCVSIVGTREATDEGASRASRLARELVASDVTVMSGLARGIDTAALTSAISNSGRTVAVIGTPLNKAYPAENASLQETIWRDHLLVSPFAEGQVVYKTNFPVRNRVMAALSDATVIVEAADTSGTLHQAAECGRLGRWLFIMKSILDDGRLSWPRKFVGKPKVAVLNSTQDIIDAIDAERA